METKYIYKKILWPTEYKNDIKYNFEIRRYDYNIRESKLLCLLNIVINVTDLAKIIQEYLLKSIDGQIQYSSIPSLGGSIITYNNITYTCDTYCNLFGVEDGIPIGIDYYLFRIFNKKSRLKLRTPCTNFVNNMYDKIKTKIIDEDERETIYDIINIFNLYFQEDIINERKRKRSKN